MGKPEDYLSDEAPIPHQSENKNSFTEEDKNWYNNTKTKRL